MNILCIIYYNNINKYEIIGCLKVIFKIKKTIIVMLIIDIYYVISKFYATIIFNMHRAFLEDFFFFFEKISHYYNL